MDPTYHRVIVHDFLRRESPRETLDPLHRAAHTVHCALNDFLIEAHLETDPDRLRAIERLLQDIAVEVGAIHTAVVDRMDRQLQIAQTDPREQVTGTRVPRR